MTDSAFNSKFSVIHLKAGLTQSELIELFSISPTSIKVIFTVDTDTVFLSKGMVAIQSGKVQIQDIHRALVAATNIPVKEQLLFQISPEFIYEIDNRLIKVDQYPIGMTGKTLSIGVKLANIPTETIENVNFFIDVFKHTLIFMKVKTQRT